MSGRRLDAARGCLLAVLVVAVMWAWFFWFAHLAGQGWAP